MVNPTNAKKMAELNKRKSASTSIKRISERVIAPEFDTWDDIQLSTELEMLNGYWSQYNSAHDELVSIAIDDDEITVHDDALAAQTDTYTRTRITLKRKVAEFETARATANAQAAATALHAAQSQNGLPSGAQHAITHAPNTEDVNRFLERIKVPKFTGEQHRWLAFYSSFKSMVHDKNYSNIEKFHYLYNSLTERARNVIGGLDTADSYEEAWTTLVKRYDNKRVIVTAHLHHFVGFQLPNRPGSNELLSLVDVTRLTTRSLRALQVPVEHWDAILVHLIAQKLDDRTREVWETEQKSTEIPKLQDMLDCIENRARTLQLAEESKGAAKPSTTNENHRQGTKRQSAVVNTSTVANVGAKTTTTGNCVLCKQDHWVHRCPQLNNTPVSDRFDLIKGISNLCFNCLRIGHTKINCQSRGCRQCPGNMRHNTLLCTQATQSSNTAQLVMDSTSYYN